MELIQRKLSVPNAERIFYLRYALHAGLDVEEIFELTKIDRWFLHNIKQLVDHEISLRRNTRTTSRFCARRSSAFPTASLPRSAA